MPPAAPERPPSPEPLLDLNPSLTFTQSHSPHATNIPYLTLRHRLHELPPPPRTLQILIKPRHRPHAEALLSSHGYTPRALRYPAGPFVAGPSSRPLFRPSPLLEAFLTDSFGFKPPRTALDIGCGSGRNAKYLTMHSFHVTAVDRDPRLLAKARDLRSRTYHHPRWGGAPEGELTTVRHTFGRDREADTAFLREHAADVVAVVRFLRRGVLELLHEGVNPGGYILYEHFLDGCEAFGGPMKASQRLRRRELRALFSARGFSIIRDDERTLRDGRPVASFIARR